MSAAVHRKDRVIRKSAREPGRKLEKHCRNYSELAFVTVNGVPQERDWRPATGTYEVNADCTGMQEIHFSNGTSLSVRLLIVDGGRQIMSNLVGNPIGGIGFKVR